MDRIPATLRSTKHDGKDVWDIHVPIKHGHTVGPVVYESIVTVALGHPLGESGNTKLPVELYIPGRGYEQVGLSWHEKIARTVDDWGAHASVVVPAGSDVVVWCEVRAGVGPAA